jgi:protoheme IX farnesyltransferase
VKVIAAEAKVPAYADYMELTKPRITLMVIATTLVGFYLGSDGPLHFMLLFHTLLGTALVASGASTLNMVLEFDADSRMRRTLARPIPSGRLTISQSVAFGSVISILGILYLLVFVNPLTCLLAAVTEGLYLFAYTPLKRVTSLCTIVGAVPGAIPPMMGWTAVQNNLSFPAWWLFAILFLWQLPHFLAIAWLYREDYARGGFPMLPVLDPEGVKTSWQIILETIALTVVSLVPSFLGFFGKGYFWGALILGSIFLIMGIRLAWTKSSMSARQLLLTSVVYLPLLLVLMVISW